jgi:site-specific DNA recombinase
VSTECVIYVRISKDRGGGGLGVARQEKDCRALAKRLGWKVTQVYSDNDMSAFSGKPREQYEALLDEIRTGNVTRVACWHTDRIHRTPRELEDYIDAGDLHGLVTHAVQAGPIDLSTPGGKAMARTLCTWAHYESEIKQQRVRAALTQNAELGKSHGGRRPYGWKPDRVHLDPVEHAEIKNLVNELLAGATLTGVTKDLNDRGVPTVMGKAWNRSMVRKMLLSPRMIAKRQHHGQIVADGNWEPALPEQLWRELGDLLNDPDRRKTPGNARVAMLPGEALCGECRQPVSTKYNGRRYYWCGTCGLWRQQEPIDAYVNGVMIELLEDAGTEPAPVVDLAAAAEADELQRKIDATKAAWTADDDPQDLLDVLRPLRAQLAEATARATPPRRRRLSAGLVGPGAAERWKALSIDKKRANIHEMIEIRLLRKASSDRGPFDENSVVIKPRW